MDNTLRIYSTSYKKISEFKSGDQILVANDVTNENRGIHLLAEAGLIKIKDTDTATPKVLHQILKTWRLRRLMLRKPLNR